MLVWAYNDLNEADFLAIALYAYQHPISRTRHRHLVPCFTDDHTVNDASAKLVDHPTTTRIFCRHATGSEFIDFGCGIRKYGSYARETADIA
jgi:hypothetical protein